MLNICKYIDGIMEVIRNLSIDEKILLMEIQWYLLVSFMMKENNLIADIIPGF